MLTLVSGTFAVDSVGLRLSITTARLNMYTGLTIDKPVIGEPSQWLGTTEWIEYDDLLFGGNT